MQTFGQWIATPKALVPRSARDVLGSVSFIAALAAGVLAAGVSWIGPATIAIEIAYGLTRKREPLWTKAISQFLLPFAVAMPAVVALQYLQNHGAFSAAQTVAIESMSRDAGSFLKDIVDLSFLRATGLLAVAVLLELLAPRWKVVSRYVGTTKVLASCSGVLAAFSCFTFTTSREFQGDAKSVRQVLQARLGSEKEEHFNVKVEERELSAQQEAIHENLAALLKLRSVNAAIQARMENSLPNLEPDVVRDPEYGPVVVRLAKSQVAKNVARSLERVAFTPLTPDAEHSKAPDITAITTALIEGVSTEHAVGYSAPRPRIDLIEDVEVLQKAVDKESAALGDEKRAEDQIRQAIREESSGVIDTLIDPLKDHLKDLIETVSMVDNGVIRARLGDLVGKYLDASLDKLKERLSGRATAALKKALAPLDKLAARAYVSVEIQKAHRLYESDLQAESKKTGADFDKWTKGSLTDAVMHSDLQDLRMAFIRDALTEPALDDSIFDRAQVLRPLEANLAEIEHEWAPKFEKAQATIEANRESDEKEGDEKMKEVEDREEHAVEHPEAHPI